MTRRGDQVSRVRENFAFDLLNRLTASSAERYDDTPTTYAAQAITYDAIGNITSKSDVGTYQYGPTGGARPHAVSAIVPLAGGGQVNTAFTYDANGNMLTGHGRSYGWTSFDMPVTITKGTSTPAFTYGIGHQRIRQVKNGGASEKITNAQGTRWIDYVSIGGRLIGTQTRADGAAPGAGVAAYYLSDHLGSIDRITDWQGTVTEVLDFDAWGKRRYPNGAPDTTGSITSSARRGFTGHEQLDSVGLVHMNGRIYDPFVARVVSADPMVQAPQNMQNYNRYTYGLNNPLSYTDPSGFFNLGKIFKKIFKAVSSFVKGFAKFVFSRQGLAIIAGIAIMAATGGFGAAWALAPSLDLGSAVLSGAIAGAASGAISTGTVKGAIFGAVSGAVASYVAGLEIGKLSGFALDSARGGLLGLSEGAIAEAQGGDFRTGFFSSAFASVAGAQVGSVLPANDVTAQLVGRSVVGGTAAVIGGGKFANGAYTAAFSYAVQKGAMSAMDSRSRSNDGSAAGATAGDSGVYSEDDPNYHHYSFEHEICSKEISACTVQNVFDQLRRYPAPMSDNTRIVSSGDITSISLAGDVVHYVDENAYTVYNITLKGHMFDPGYVQRSVVDRGATISIVTTGEGIGGYRGFNLEVAEPSFNALDMQIRMNIYFASER